MADEIRESIEIDTDTAVGNVDDLKSSLQKADEWIDNVIDKARAADREEVSVPVETPGAVPAAENLDKVDAAARRAGDGAKVGVSAISDLTGPLGDASSKAGEMGQAVEGLGGILESVAGKMGLSQAATKKLSGVIGLAAVAVGIGAAAWTIYSDEQKRAKKGAEEVAKALQDVQDKLAAGDAAAAADSFISGMNDKIDAFRSKFLPGASTVDIAGAMFGDPASIKAVDTAIGELDESARFLAESGVKTLEAAWDSAKTATEEQVAMKSKIEDLFGATAAAADTATGAIDTYVSALGRSVSLTPSANKAYNDAVAKYGAGNVTIGPTPTTTHVTNNYPPANTPLAVEQANERWRTTQGYT